MNCIPKAFCAVTGIPYDKMIEDIGHDGLAVLWPDLQPPFCFRSFHPAECFPLLVEKGFSVTQFDRKIFLGPDRKHCIEIDLRLPKKSFYGVAIGLGNRGVRHAFPFDHCEYDGSTNLETGEPFDIEIMDNVFIVNHFTGAYWGTAKRPLF